MLDDWGYGKKERIIKDERWDLNDYKEEYFLYKSFVYI